MDHIVNSYFGDKICHRVNLLKQRNLDQCQVLINTCALCWYHMLKRKVSNIGLTIPGNGSFEIRRISTWNLLDFTWNLPDFMKSVRNLADFTRNPYEIRRISWMWAFAWWSSIGLSFERPITLDQGRQMLIFTQLRVVSWFTLHVNIYTLCRWRVLQAFTERLGYLVYGAYNAAAVIVLLNMLIAMMSRSFDSIQVKSNQKNGQKQHSIQMVTYVHFII